MPLATPDVTRVQQFVAAFTAVIVAAIGVVDSFGWANITVDQSAKLLGLWAALGGVAVVADAVIRHGRATAQAAANLAAASKPVAPVVKAPKRTTVVRKP